jgi:hypothetical protein
MKLINQQVKGKQWNNYKKHLCPIHVLSSNNTGNYRTIYKHFSPYVSVAREAQEIRAINARQSLQE